MKIKYQGTGERLLTLPKGVEKLKPGHTFEVDDLTAAQLRHDNEISKAKGREILWLVEKPKALEPKKEAK